ncbi:RluA family pseudouridine synthase [Spirochaetota bacterium]
MQKIKQQDMTVEKYTVKADNSMRAEKLVKLKYPHLSRNEIHSLFSDNRVSIKKLPVKKGHIIKKSENITVLLNEAQSSGEISPNSTVKFSIVFEDTHLLAVSKPENTHTVPVSYADSDTLMNGIKHYTGSMVPLPSPLNAGSINRLDFETTGLVLLAKTEEAYKVLTANYKKVSTEKYYFARVHGIPENYVFMQDSIGEKGGTPKNGEAELLIIKKYKKESIVLLRLITGLRHQLRIQLSNRGYPIKGDRLYGSKEITSERMYLHSYSVELNHPCTNKRMILCAHLPDQWEV